MSMTVRLRSRKTETYDFKAFMRKEHETETISVKKSAMSLLPLAVTPFVPIKAFAKETTKAISETAMQTKIMAAFHPIIVLAQSLAYPVALIVVLGGGLLVMIGNTEKGLAVIQRAGMGYVLVMMLPMLLDVVVSAMQSVL